MSFDLTPSQEDQIYREMEEFSGRVASKRMQLSPQLAQTVSDVYRRYPTADASVLLSAAQAYTEGKMSEDQLNAFVQDFNKMEYEKSIAEQEANKKKNRSWFERNVASKFRTGTRWAFAAGEFTLQSVQNIGSKIFNIGETFEELGTELGMGQQRGPQYSAPLAVPGRTAAITQAVIPTKGFVISTDFGTLLENSNVAGDGFFIGGEAARLQGERARRYRGEIAGKAWSFGRGTANLIVQPGTVPYNVLSGIVDAVPAIGVPAAPGAPQVKAGGKILANRLGLRTLSGLTDYSSAMIIPEKAAGFLNSRSGRNVIKTLTEVDSIDEAIEIFPRATPAFLKGVVDTTDEVSMKQFLIDTIGLEDPSRGRAATSIDDINLSSYDNWKRQNILQKESKVARMMAKMPGRHVVLAGGSDREKMDSIRNVKNYLRSLNKTVKKAVPEEQRKELVEKFARALIDDDGSMRNVVTEIENVSRVAMNTMGFNPKVTDKLLSGIRQMHDIVDKALYQDMGPDGKSMNYGGRFTAQDGKGGVFISNQPLNTAAVQTEALKHIMMLPDPRQVRRLVSSFGWLTGKGTPFWIKGRTATKGIGNIEKVGEIRVPVAMAEFITNQLWKPLALLTGAYAVRNMSDSLLRQTFSPNLKSGVYHPLDLIMIATHRRYKGDLLGDMLKGDPEELLRRDQRDLVEATNMGMRELDPVSRETQGILTGAWKRVIREDGYNEFSQGVAAEIALLAGDDVAKRVARGDTTEEIIEYLQGEGRQYLRRLENMWRNRNLVDEFGNQNVGSIKFFNDDGTIFEPNVREYIDSYVSPRIEATTGGSTKLREIVGGGGFTDEAGEFVPVFKMDGSGVYEYLEDNLYPLIRTVMDDPTVNLKTFYKAQVKIDNLYDKKNSLIEAKNWVIDKFFGELYPKREAFLNRSPAFRQFYYKMVGEWLDELAPGEAANIVASIKKAAARENKKYTSDYLSRYVGSRELANRIIDKAEGKVVSNGKLSLTELDSYAKGYALDETKRLFYDATEKSNYADILRIIVPFGSAWAEVTQKWVKMLTTEPETLKRVGVSVQGIRDADPDNDGKGFFYKDPTTGEYMFNYPFSDQLGPFMMGFTSATLGGIAFGLPGVIGGGLLGSGAGAALQTQLGDISPFAAAPARSFNMALSLYPGTAPIVQIPAAAILSKFPEADFLSKIVTPYGAPDMSAVAAPSWAIKMYQAVLGDPEKDRMFGDLVMDTMKALGSSGKYDLTDPKQIEELENEAIQQARILMVFRALGQLAGPVRPTIEFEIDTKQGDVYASELSKAFYEMQAENYDTSVERFMETFGDDAFLYVAGKTKAIDGGLDASVEFGRWERKNRGIFETYPDVAGYFAPVGSTFDYQVYLRQINSGSRERLTPKEMIEEAQFRVGSAAFRSLRRSFGENPSAAEESLLRRFKNEVYDRYPGYRDADMNVNERKTRINKLYDAVQDKRLDGNPVAEALRIYLQARDEALAIAVSRGIETGIGGKKNADIRGQLFRLGEQLADQFPEFDRLWDRVLFGEVDIDFGAMLDG